MKTKRHNYFWTLKRVTCTAAFVLVSKEIRYLLWFCISTLCDWHEFSRALRRLHDFCFELWLVQWIVCLTCDWPVWLLGFWFENSSNGNGSSISPNVRFAVSWCDKFLRWRVNLHVTIEDECCWRYSRWRNEINECQKMVRYFSKIFNSFYPCTI